MNKLTVGTFCSKIGHVARRNHTATAINDKAYPVEVNFSNFCLYQLAITRTPLIFGPSCPEIFNTSFFTCAAGIYCLEHNTERIIVSRVHFLSTSYELRIKRSP